MLSMLSIAVHSGLHSSWDAIGNRLGAAQQIIADRVQVKNLENEIEAMKMSGVAQINNNGNMKWPLTCMYDMGWQKRASSNSFNSQSGHGLLLVRI